MDLWKFYDITHREHVLCNPTSIEKIDELISLLRLRPGAGVVDIATGKAEFLFRLAERYDIAGTGVDLSPYFLSEAKNRLRDRVPDGRLEFLEMDGANFKSGNPQNIALASCLGASWIYGGHRGTLRALSAMTAAGSWVVTGEPYWRREPAAEYLQAIAEDRSTFGSHWENVAEGQALGLEPVYTLVSNQDDWDRYEGLQWYGADAWAREHPEDPDIAEVLSRVRREKESYLKWGRDALGWAIYVFRKA